MTEEWDRISVPSFADGRELKVRVLRWIVSKKISKFEKICPQWFPETAGWNLRVNVFPIRTKPCCNNLEGKRMSDVRNKTSVLRPCNRWKSTLADFHAILCEETRSIHNKLEIQCCYFEQDQADSFSHDVGVHVCTSLAIKNGNNCFEDLFRFPNLSFLETLQLASTSVQNKDYESCAETFFEFRIKFLNMILPLCTSGLATMKLPLLDNLTDGIFQGL